MRPTAFLAHTIAAVAVAGFALSPTLALAQGKGKGKGREHAKGQWKPKHSNRGRTDNSAWNRRSDDWRRHDDWAGGNWNRAGIPQGSIQREIDRRQQTKNEWRNLAIGAGAVALLGLLQKDNRLVFAGAAGALYSLHRYEQDRKSQSRLDRARAHYFSQPYFYRDGRRYDRRVVAQNGQRYYQFVCR